jgi:DNA-binding HxlR family transcriptional regulator
MVVLDLLGRRWVLRILWELRSDTVTFRELRARCDGMSPSVLNQRLGELRDTGIVELADGGYRLTAHGADLLSVLAPINEWAKRWAKREARGSG